MFAHRHIVLQVLLVNSSKRSQKVAGRRPQPFDCVDVYLSHSIPIIISGPLPLAVTHRAVIAVYSVIAFPFICITGCLLPCVPVHVLSQSLAVCVLAHSQTTKSAFSPYSSYYRGTIILIGAVPSLFVGTSARWIAWIGMKIAFFPPRSETSHQFRYPGRARHSGLKSHKHSVGFFCANDAHIGVRGLVPLIRWLRVRPCRHLAEEAQLDAAQGCCQRIWCRCRGCRCSDIFDIGNQQSRACECERLGRDELLRRSQGIAVLWGENISPPTEHFLGHRANRLLGRSFSDFNMHKLVT